jgi:hypothetical protein
VLEAHLAALTPRPLLPVSALQPQASRLGRAGRDTGVFDEDAGLNIGSDTNGAWAATISGRASRSWDQVHTDGPTGIAADRNGTILAYKSLPRDSLGTLVSESYLAGQLEVLLRTAYEVIPTGIGEIAPTSGVEPVDRVAEGDPAALGHRSSSTLRMSGSPAVRTAPDAKIAVAALPGAIPEVTRELAARLMAELRTSR